VAPGAPTGDKIAGATSPKDTTESG
jgi:hypothetical protein